MSTIITRNITLDFEYGHYDSRAKINAAQIGDPRAAQTIYEGLVSASGNWVNFIEHVLEKEEVQKSDAQTTTIELQASSSYFSTTSGLVIKAELSDELIDKIKKLYTELFPVVTAKKILLVFEEIEPSPLREFETLIGAIFGGKLAGGIGLSLGDYVDVTIVGGSFGHPSESDSPFAPPFLGFGPFGFSPRS